MLNDINTEWHVNQLARRVGLKPHQRENISVNLYHRPGTVIAVVRKKDDRLPIGVGHAFKNPKVQAEYVNLERIAIRRALDSSFPLMRIL